MTALTITLMILTVAVLAIWTSRHVLIAKERRAGFVLTEDYAAPEAQAGADCPRISVVVAAKDEAENIGPCVRSMLDQDYDDFEMIVVDDRSTDGTERIAREAAAGDGRVRLLRVEELPEGWCGKNHAMQTGIAQATGQWLCMIDADCRQTSRRSLRVAVDYARHTQADLLSILPNLEMKGFWENAVQPVGGGIMMIWFRPDKVNDPKKPHAYANGAFMLMRRSAYERIGTHAAVKDKFNEDMHLAARTKSAGLRLRVVRNRGLYAVRMYTSLGEIVRGWGRIFLGTFGTARRLWVSLLVLVVMGLSPYVVAAFGLAAAAAGAEPGAALLACGLMGAAAAAMQISVMYRFYKLVGARSELAWSYPLGCVVSVASLVLALSKLRRGARITWRDTSYVHEGRT